MAQTKENGDYIIAAIQAEVARRVDEEIKKITAEAIKRLLDTLTSQADSVALHILKFYTVERREESIIITVKKEV